MSALNLFPVRVPIGKVNAAGEVIMSREFANALSNLIDRVGGENGTGTSDLEGRSAYSLLGLTGAQPAADAAFPTEDPHTRLADLARQVEQLQHLLANTAPATPEPNYADYVHAYALPTPTYVDWERPGAVGATTPNTGKFSTLQSVGGFGCNTKTPQTAFALGAAAVDLPTVIILANNLRTMSINNGTGS